MWWWRRQRYVQLEIEKILEHAEEIVPELPNHDGLHHLAGNVAESIREADRCTRAMSRPWNLYRLPPYFLITSIALLVAWLYWQFLHVASVEVALPSSDTAELRARLDEPEDLRPTIRNHRGLARGHRTAHAGRGRHRVRAGRHRDSRRTPSA